MNLPHYKFTVIREDNTQAFEKRLNDVEALFHVTDVQTHVSVVNGNMLEYTAIVRYKIMRLSE